MNSSRPRAKVVDQARFELASSSIDSKPLLDVFLTPLARIAVSVDVFAFGETRFRWRQDVALPGDPNI